MKGFVEKKSWKEFRETGLLWFINTILHLFGWVIVYDPNREISYLARTKYRGFEKIVNDKNYKKVTEYLRENIDELYSDMKE